jgi:hypothetical protein
MSAGGVALVQNREMRSLTDSKVTTNAQLAWANSSGMPSRLRETQGFLFVLSESRRSNPPRSR